MLNMKVVEPAQSRTREAEFRGRGREADRQTGLPFVLSFARAIECCPEVSSRTVTLCPDRQIGVSRGRAVIESVEFGRSTTCQVTSDGRDAIAVDFEEDD